MSTEELSSWRGSISQEEACPYLEGRRWQNFVLDAGDGLSAEQHEHLLDSGFRRMGTMFFQPVCPTCQECRTMRVPVHLFQPSKSLRRAYNKNRDLVVKMSETHYTEEKRELLERYLESRHEGPMVAEAESVREFMFTGSPRGMEMDYYLDGQLVAVGLVDVLPNIVSSLYFYFEPSLLKRSIGIASMMFEIDWCRENNKTWYHPGFYVRGCSAMSYKGRFQPAEVLRNDGTWEPLVP